MKDSDKSKSGFRLIIIWSLGFLFAFALFGILFRVVFPIERILGPSEFIDKVFLEDESVYFRSADDEEPAGTIEGGTILFVIDVQNEKSLVRPLPTTKPDSIWVPSGYFIAYNRENFRQWLLEEERKRHN
ncbi:MAG: hypothetical protein EA391_10555 [Balneolaceae bacterium]|nr:MAG: hypothetical protein EA391_10555 [Balneolaceae bacterium]